MPTSIKALLSGFVQSNQRWKTDLLNQWGAIMGNLAQHVTIVKILNDTIILGVYDSSWMQELYMLSAMLLKKINAHLDEPRIAKIKFIIAEKSRHKSGKRKISVEHKISNIQLSAQEEQSLEVIEDPELQTALKTFLTRCRAFDE